MYCCPVISTLNNAKTRVTQFLLVQSPDQASIALDMECTPAARIADAFTLPMPCVFRDVSTPIWKVSPPGNEMDVLVEQAREALLAGASLQETVLGRTLRRLAVGGFPMALLYATDTDDIPLAKSPEEFMKQVSEQLTRDENSWPELYVRWAGNCDA